jgi:3-oxoacyl-[acyl-carrier protein] reductase
MVNVDPQGKDIPAGNEFSGKVIMITGAAQGIGYELAHRLYDAGSSIWIVDINSTGAETACESIGGLNRSRVGSCAIDVCSVESVQVAVQSCIETFGRLDILINNAGIVGRGKIEEMDVNLWKKILDVNLTGCFVCSQAVIPIMRNAGKGIIINVSSISARMPGIGLSAYCCSKAAIETFTKILAAEVAPYGIRVNAYAPGVTKTAMTKDIITSRGEEKLKNIALQRFGETVDVAELVLFLCSDRSSWMTGEVIHLDGGTMIVERPWEAWQK